MARKTPTKRVVDVRLTVLDGGSIPPISTPFREAPVFVDEYRGFSLFLGAIAPTVWRRVLRWQSFCNLL